MRRTTTESIQGSRAVDEDAAQQEDSILGKRGHYGTPYGPGPQCGSGDQYAYGAGYSCTRRAPDPPPTDQHDNSGH